MKHMEKRGQRKLGISMISLSMMFLVFYTWSLFFTESSILVMQATLYAIILILIGIIVWMGKTILQSPSIGKEINK